MKIPTTHRDIEEVIKQVQLLLPDVVVRQHTVTHEADDDGLWYFSLPSVDIQVESSYGKCPFVIETDEQSSSDALEALTVEQTVKLIADYLNAASE
jgi:hypothetical protein